MLTLRPFSFVRSLRSAPPRLLPLFAKRYTRAMATVREDSIPHIVRTAHEQRAAGVWNATIGRIEPINSTIRLIRLDLNGHVVGPRMSRWVIHVASNTAPKLLPTMYDVDQLTVNSQLDPTCQVNTSTSTCRVLPTLVDSR